MKTLPGKTPTSKTYLPPDLGKSAIQPAVKTNTVGFFQACVEARGPHDLNKFHPITHSAATLLEHMQVHGVPITVERGMTEQELKRATPYGAHSSATKETNLFRTDLAKQAREGHIALFLLRAVRHLP